MQRIVKGLVGLLSSMGLSCVLVLLLFVLTWLGTLHQVEHGLYLSQKLYFESWWLWHQLDNGWSVPLPGGQLVMVVLFVNLLVGGILRLRLSPRRVGVLITHVGILLLLVAGFVKFRFSDEGAMQLFEGQRASEYHSYHEWELAIAAPPRGGRRVEHLIPESDLADLGPGRSAVFRGRDLPFEVEVGGLLENCRPSPKGPMFEAPAPVVDGFFLSEQPRRVEAERNVRGCYVTVRTRDGRKVLREGILWGLQAAPLVVTAEGRDWTFDLRKRRMSVPFTVELDDTQRELHPGTRKPRAYMSDVTVYAGEPGAVDQADVVRQLRIQMNEPLRHQGFVLYQSGWGPDDARPGDRVFSVFAVMRNPADRWPLYACIIIALGLTLHFSQKLSRHIRSELETAS